MNAFEEIVAGLLGHEGYWTHVGYKIDLPKEKKAELGKPSMPRPEIDILAYKACENRLVWVECKSFLDSGGVRIYHLTNEKDVGFAHYKVFTFPQYRKIVTEELIKQVVTAGLACPNPTVDYCLVAGRIATENDREQITKHFEKNGWLFYDIKWIWKKLNDLSKIGYEDDVAVIVAKLITNTTKA